MLVLRALIALVPIAVLVVFAFSDRIAHWLPQSTAFAIVFIVAGLALIVWMSGITGERGAAEREIYLRALGRLASWLRTKRRRV